MPPVVLFNKPWRIGTDDFVYPSVLELGIRLGWTVALSFVLGFHVHELEHLKCLGKEYKFTTGYLVTSIFIQCFASVNLMFLCHYSAMGRIFDRTEPHPRRHVSSFIYCNILLTALEFVITIVGTFFAIKDLMRCISEVDERVVIIVILVVISLTYLLLFIKMLVAIAAIKPFSTHLPEEEHLLLSHRETLQKRESALTYRGLRCLMPCYNDEGTIQAFKEISLLLSKIFHDSELVPTDILAGLVLLHFKHHYERQMGLRITMSSVRQDMDADVLNLKYYFKYSVAAYGSWFYLLQNPLPNLVNIGAHLNCCFCVPCIKPETNVVEGGGCCNCNLAAAKAQLDVEDDDFIALDNRNRVQEVPYFLVLDHKKKVLVVSIRGTLSLSDMFTDLRGEPGHLHDFVPEIPIGLNPAFKGHKGMVTAARYVYRRLHGLPDPHNPSSKDRTSKIDHLNLTLAQFPDYGIVVTGHSLGAGTAAILTFLLRSQYTDREIQCYAYSPPGGLLCPAAATESEKFTVSLVVGDDVIPRTSLNNIARLSTDIRTACENCELPKYKLLGHGAISFCCCTKTSIIKEEVERFCSEEPLFHRSQIYAESATPPLSVCSTEVLVEIDPSPDSLLEIEPAPPEPPAAQLVSPHCDPMYLPGRILYIEESEENGCTISTRDRNSFSQILVSPRMLMDHMPNYISRVLDML